MIDDLRLLSQQFIAIKMADYRRYLINTVPLSHRFGIILGERGVGKTTTMIQYLLSAVDGDQYSDQILYVPADHFLINKTTLYEIAEQFFQLGVQVIAFDEIHKYPNWSMELKSIYDTFPGLRLLASGSSALEIQKGSHDLSRRAIVHRMVGLSFREYIELTHGLSLPVFTLEKLLDKHTRYATQIHKELTGKNLKILKLFKTYLQSGYYPYFREFDSPSEYHIALEQTLHATIDADLLALYPQLTGNSLYKIKQLLVYIAGSVPFTPNWHKIKSMIGIGDDRTVKTYFKYLEDAGIIRRLMANTRALKKLEIPEKVWLGNTNQIYSLSTQPNSGNIRETFFLSMLTQQHTVTTTKETDCCIDGQFYIEIGGKLKNRRQIHGLKNAYLAIDDIEIGAGERVPLWLFGFLY